MQVDSHDENNEHEKRVQKGIEEEDKKMKIKALSQ
jgi:hypothetical protein